MFNFKKVYNWKIIIIIAGIMIYPAVLTANGRDALCEKTNLRVPLLSANSGSLSRMVSAASSVDKLASKIGIDITFRLPKDLTKRYALKVRQDFVDYPNGKQEQGKPAYMVYAETIPENKGDKPYPVAMATGIFMAQDDVAHLGWRIVLDYPSIFREIKTLQQMGREHGVDKSLFYAMKFYILNAVSPQAMDIAPQMRFLYFHLKSMLPDGVDEDSIVSDEIVVKFFEGAPKDLRRMGIGNALIEFISSFIPVGGKISFSLSNYDSLAHISRGGIFEESLIGNQFQNLGYKGVIRNEGSPWSLPAYVLEKKEQVTPKTQFLTNTPKKPDLADQMRVDERSFPPGESGSDFGPADVFSSVIRKALGMGILQETANAACGHAVEILGLGELKYVFSGRDSESRGKREGSQAILLLPVEIKDIGTRNFIFVVDNHSMSHGAYTVEEYDNLKRLNGLVPKLFVKVYQTENIAINRDKNNLLPIYTAEALGDQYRPFYLVGQRPLGIGSAFLYARDLESAYTEHYKGEIAPEAADEILVSLVARLTELQVKHGLIVKEMNFYEGDVMIDPALPPDHDEYIKITAARKLEEGTLYDLLMNLLFLRQDTRHFNGDKTEENAQVFSPRVVFHGIYRGLINSRGEESARSIMGGLVGEYLSKHGEHQEVARKFIENMSLESRYKAILGKLSRIDEGHLLDGWDKLSQDEQNELLRNIEGIDWNFAEKALREARMPAKPIEDLTALQPKSADDHSNAATRAGEEVLTWGADADPDKDKAMLGGLIMAGGGGRRFGYEEGTKGIFPDATPLSGTSFYQCLVNRVESASAAYGHASMFPLGIGVSRETEKDTLNFARQLPLGIKKRIIIVRQRELPLLEQGSMKYFKKTKTRIATGGTGHADAYDYILKPDVHARGFAWSEDKNDFVEEVEVAQWFRGFGVQYVQYMGVDNVLTPFAMKRLVGEHHLSRNRETEKREKRAHITHVIIEKLSPGEKLANFLQTGSGMKLTRDYLDASEEQRNMCRFGGPSISIATIDSLEGSETSPWSMDKGKKESKYSPDGTLAEISMVKLEGSHLNTPRSSNSVEIGVPKDDNRGLSRDDIFSETKTMEQLIIAKRQQSEHWKKLARKAGFIIPDSMTLELPFNADYLNPDKLKGNLDGLNFRNYIKEEAGVLITADFGAIYNAGITEFEMASANDFRSEGILPGYSYLYMEDLLKSRLGEEVYGELDRDFSFGNIGFARIIFELAGNSYRHSLGGRIVIERIFRNNAAAGISITLYNRHNERILFDDFIQYPEDMAHYYEDTDTAHQGLFILMKYADEFSLKSLEEGDAIRIVKWAKPGSEKKIDFDMRPTDIERTDAYGANLINVMKVLPEVTDRLKLLSLDDGEVGQLARDILVKHNLISPDIDLRVTDAMNSI